MSATVHPDAEDYRNRAERAEQALAELAGHDGLSLAVALMRAEQQLATERTNADKLAEALELTDLALRGANMNLNVVERKACQALAAHNLLRIDG